MSTSENAMTVPILDLREQYDSMRTEIHAAIDRVLESTQFILGPDVAELERNVAQYCGTRHAIGVASGTDALRLAFAALGVGPGDEVITTPFTFIATANTIVRSGATPVFADIDRRSMNIDPAAIEAAITPRTRAIVPVHLYGAPADMDPIMDIAKRHSLAVVEDCAQSLGAEYGGRKSGAIGDVGCLSFFPSKNLGAYGDAGMVVTNDDELATKIDVLRRHGGAKKYYHELVGFNSRIDTLQAAVLNVKLPHLDEWNSRRRAVARRYNELLADLPVVCPLEATPGTTHVFHQYTIRTERRDELAAMLKGRGITTMVYYPVPLHQQKVFAHQTGGSFPESEAAAREVLSLPIYPELTEAQQEYVAAAIVAFFAA